MGHSSPQIDAFREQILNAAKNKAPLSIEGGGTKSWYGNDHSFKKLHTQTYSGILEYQPEELVITACAGTPLQEIEAALAEKNQVLAFEPPHFGERATFGGGRNGLSLTYPTKKYGVTHLSLGRVNFRPPEKVLRNYLQGTTILHRA